MTITSNARKIENYYFAEKLLNERKHRVLDVRTPLMYRDGTIFEAPSAPVRNFTTEFAKVRKDTNKVILIGSREDTSDLEACIRYANSFPITMDDKYLNLSYVYYEEMLESKEKEKKKGS